MWYDHFQILNCKPAVKKAKVHVIRDIRKKIGILKRCKKENQKEKKHKKAERLIHEIMTIKVSSLSFLILYLLPYFQLLLQLKDYLEVLSLSYLVFTLFNTVIVEHKLLSTKFKHLKGICLLLLCKEFKFIL